jgi:hypothetical protein
MEVVVQRLEDISASLRPLAVDWKDDTARRVIDILRDLPVKDLYTVRDVADLLDNNFDEGILICRLFLGLSKDQFVSLIKGVLGNAGIGVKSYRLNPEMFL